MRYMASQSPAHFFAATALAPAALLFDWLDGRVARWRHMQSALGRELDSLADIISFGVAPAALGFAAGLRGGWDWIALTYFVCCGVSRLARYNVTAESLSRGGDKVAYFEGTPIPTTVLLTGVLALAAWQDRLGENLYWGAMDSRAVRPAPLVLAVRPFRNLDDQQNTTHPKSIGSLRSFWFNWFLRFAHWVFRSSQEDRRDRPNRPDKRDQSDQQPTPAPRGPNPSRVQLVRP